MAKKQAITSKIAVPAPARTAKPATPRVSSAKHSKQVSAIPETTMPENRHESISKIAYGYWIARGYQGGSPHEDWLRAEQDYLSR